MNVFYVYQYEKTDGTPYYIGKGVGQRAYTKHGNIQVPNEKKRIVIVQDNLTEDQAYKLEKQLIKSYGRLVNHTGTLHNIHPGGAGRFTKYNLSHKKIQEDYLSGYGIRYVAKKYGLGIGTVYRIIEGLDTSDRVIKPYTPNNYKKKTGRPTNLTEEIKEKVIIDYSKGIVVKKIQKAYGIGCGTIYKILDESGIRPIPKKN